jgi:hypothetical protein
MPVSCARKAVFWDSSAGGAFVGAFGALFLLAIEEQTFIASAEWWFYPISLAHNALVSFFAA